MMLLPLLLLLLISKNDDDAYDDDYAITYWGSNILKHLQTFWNAIAGMKI